MPSFYLYVVVMIVVALIAISAYLGMRLASYNSKLIVLQAKYNHSITI
ncbi:MAG: hypothetical protein ACP5L5_08015 [Vulcanisaeta sp.]